MARALSSMMLALGILTANALWQGATPAGPSRYGIDR